MNILNDMEQRRMTAADLTMESTDCSKIDLPFVGELLGGFFHEVLNMAYTHLPLDKVEQLTESGAYGYDQMIEELRTSFHFNVQPKQIRITAYIDVLPVHSDRFQGRLFVQAADDEIAEVLDAFFNAGARGLREDYARHYAEKYQAWRKAKIKD